MSTPITLRGLVKKFGATVAVDHVDLDVPPGSLFFLLGPSGCGKTTLLRMLAGFTQPTAGVIRFGDRDVTHLPANRRNCGMVFQGYALWPHMTVAQNVGFGLSVRKIAGEQRKQRVDAALRQVRMLQYADRKPNELSGGQQQRVALARAMVIEPTLLLLDEPLSNLDAKLRMDMRSQIREVCSAAAITAVYVTHDQKEALSMADHMAVMQEGKVMQVGSPRELYDRPNSRFVADFLGETNFISAEVIERSGREVRLRSSGVELVSCTVADHVPSTGNVTCSIRPEAVQISRAVPGADSEANGFVAKRIQTTYMGELAQHQLSLGDGLSLKAFELNPRPMDGSSDLWRLRIDPKDVVILRD
jgi:iron(III) transport system ATP-binding protein